jgi:hypothetical protein
MHSLQRLREAAKLFASSNQDQFEYLQEDYRTLTPRAPFASIKFLGTGQGTHHIAARGVLNHDARAVSGPIISSLASAVWIDPGPDALAVLNRENLDPRHVDGLLVSHAHVDHFGNIACAAEAISGGTEIKRQKIVYGNRTAIDGAAGSPRILSDYHMTRILKECRALHPFETANVGDIKVTALPCSHQETSESNASLNWKLDVPVGGRRCSVVHYDGNVFEVAGNDPGPVVLDVAKGEALLSDVLIVNVSNHVRVRSSRQNYVSTSGLLYLARETSAKVVFTTHFGIEMFRVSKPERALLEEFGFASIPEFQALYAMQELRSIGIERLIIPATDGMLVGITAHALEVESHGMKRHIVSW